MRPTLDDASTDSRTTDSAATLAPAEVREKFLALVSAGGSSGFGDDNKHQKMIISKAQLNGSAVGAAAAGAADDTERKQIHPANMYRYGIPAYVDPLIEGYNTNRVTTGSTGDTPSGAFIGEGPIEYHGAKLYSNTERFFNHILFGTADGVNFKTILALGPFKEHGVTKFLNYFNPEESIQFSTFRNFAIQTKIVSKKHDSLHVYDIEVLNKLTQQKKRLRVFHIPSIQDMGELTIDLQKESDRALAAYLLTLQSHSQTNPLFIHCAAGLGRSGLIAYLLEVYKNYDRLMQITNPDERAQELFAIWDAMNGIRPGTIQNQRQCLSAFPVVEAMHTLQAQLTDEKETAGAGAEIDEGQEAEAYLQKLIPELIAPAADNASAAASAASSTAAAETVSTLFPDKAVEFPTVSAEPGSSTDYDDSSSAGGSSTPGGAAAAQDRVRLLASTGSRSSEYPSSSSGDDLSLLSKRPPTQPKGADADGADSSSDEEQQDPPSPGSGSSSS